MHLLTFKGGIPMNMAFSPDELMPMLLKQYAHKIQVLQADTHDITPRSFNFRRFDYSVEVKPDGTGTLFLTARYKDAATQEMTRKGLTRPSHGDKAYRFPQDQQDFLLAGSNARRKLTLWLYLFYEEDK